MNPNQTTHRREPPIKDVTSSCRPGQPRLASPTPESKVSDRTGSRNEGVAPRGAPETRRTTAMRSAAAGSRPGPRRGQERS